MTFSQRIPRFLYWRCWKFCGKYLDRWFSTFSILCHANHSIREPGASQTSQWCHTRGRPQLALVLAVISWWCWDRLGALLSLVRLSSVSFNWLHPVCRELAWLVYAAYSSNGFVCWEGKVLWSWQWHDRGEGLCAAAELFYCSFLLSSLNELYQ